MLFVDQDLINAFMYLMLSRTWLIDLYILCFMLNRILWINFYVLVFYVEQDLIDSFMCSSALFGI